MYVYVCMYMYVSVYHEFVYACLRDLKDIETSGLRQMKGIWFLLNSYFSDLQILRSERSGMRFYHEICVAKTKSRRNTRFAANERYLLRWRSRLVCCVECGRSPDRIPL